MWKQIIQYKFLQFSRTHSYEFTLNDIANIAGDSRVEPIHNSFTVRIKR